MCSGQPCTHGGSHGGSVTWAPVRKLQSCISGCDVVGYEKGSRHKSLLSLFVCHQIIICIIYYEWPYGIITAQQIHINRCTDTERRQSHVRDAGMPRCDVWSSSPPPLPTPWAISSSASAVRQTEEMKAGEFISHAGIVSAWWALN